MAVWPNGSRTIPRVTAEFGPYDPFGTGTSMHNGIDLVDFDIVRAAVAGDIIYAGYNGDAGNEVRIRAADGVVYRYLHNRAFIRTGGSVAEGEAIAYQGTTGAVTGKHCHFEIWSNGQRGSAVNPRIFMAQLIAAGAADIGAGQRTANAVVNRRREATSASAIAGEPLQPGDVGNFTHWKRGESVEGNNVWFRGTSGNWFWSGGFKEGANTAGLKDLNPEAPPTVSPTQRVVGGNTVNRRIGDASSSAPAGEPLQPGDVGNFTHWKRGESVEGNDVWFKGTSGDYFWSGGFVGGANTSGLPEEVRTPAPAPIGPQQRRVKASDSVNGRTDHNTGAAIVQSLAPGTVADFKAYAEGQAVEGNSIWFQGAHAGNWFWSGAFEGGANTTGLPKLEAPAPGPTPAPTPPQTGAIRVTPVYPGAKEGWDTPRGREKRDKYGDRPGVQVDTAALHYTGNASDNLEYFKGSGDGSVPTWFVRPNGDVFEMCRPDLRPVTTYKANNYTVSFEIQMLADGSVSPESLEAVAKCLAWVADQKEINGVPFKYVLDRAHTKGHREFPENNTACPGDFVMARIDSVVERAKAIRAGAPNPKPSEPKPADPPTPGATVEVDRGWLGSIWEKIGKILGK